DDDEPDSALPEHEAAERDADVADARPVPTPPDAGAAPASEADDEAPRAPEAALTSYAACPAESAMPTLSAVRLLGDRPELILGCGRETHVLAIVPSASGGLMPTRVMTLRLGNERLRGEPEGAAVVTADVNADGRVDLVLGHLVAATRNTSQQGVLDWIARDERGGFDAPVALAPIAVSSIAAAELDAARGAELVALHQADRFGRRPSEAWVFGGGAAPARTTRLDAGATARVVRILDLDRDGELDVITLGDGDPGGRVYFGDGTGRFPRNQALVLAGAREAAVGNIDGDGAADLIVGGDSVRLVAARGQAAQIVAQPLEITGRASNLHIADLDGDGRNDLLALRAEGVGVLAQKEPLRFEARPLLDVPLAAGTIVAFIAADLGGGDALDFALLLDAPEPRGYELVVVLDPAAHAIAMVSTDPAPIPDAPLSLQIDLR
ncbi:MAG: VCBS repeat-containing protein, partial [Polyangiaceae bacterium]|nr:VCBS repeat-containing protein [Polyangiaceae bacterium]